MLQADGDINAQFVQYTDNFAKNNFTIVQYIYHSQIIVEGNLWVGNSESDKAEGKIFGSLLQSGGVIHVGTFGSTSGALTKLNFNYWVNSVAELKAEADEQSKKINTRLPRIYKLLHTVLTQDDGENCKVDRIEIA